MMKIMDIPIGVYEGTPSIDSIGHAITKIREYEREHGKAPDVMYVPKASYDRLYAEMKAHSIDQTVFVSRMLPREQHWTDEVENRLVEAEESLTGATSECRDPDLVKKIVDIRRRLEDVMNVFDARREIDRK